MNRAWAVAALSAACLAGCSSNTPTPTCSSSNPGPV